MALGIFYNGKEYDLDNDLEERAYYDAKARGSASALTQQLVDQGVVQPTTSTSSTSSTSKFADWWDKNGKFTMDTAGNILNLVTGAIVAANGTYDPNSVYMNNSGYLTQAPMMYRRSSGMSATTKIVLFGALGAAIIVGAVLYKKSKRKKRREEREREEEYEIVEHLKDTEDEKERILRVNRG